MRFPSLVGCTTSQSQSHGATERHETFSVQTLDNLAWGSCNEHGPSFLVPRTVDTPDLQSLDGEPHNLKVSGSPRTLKAR